MHIDASTGDVISHVITFVSSMCRVIDARTEEVSQLLADVLSCLRITTPTQRRSPVAALRRRADRRHRSVTANSRPDELTRYRVKYFRSRSCSSTLYTGHSIPTVAWREQSTISHHRDVIYAGVPSTWTRIAIQLRVERCRSGKSSSVHVLAATSNAE